MITNEAEIRIALQAVLVSVLALYGFWGCALMVLLILLPWKPILAVGGYLAQPIVDWRIQKARARHDRGIAQIEQELDALLRSPEKTPCASSPNALTKSSVQAKPFQVRSPQPLEPLIPKGAGRIVLQNMPGTAQNLSAALAISPAIKNHVRNLPQGVFTNMDLEVEEIKFHGDTAEAYVRFKSPNVTELVIRQRYLLRKSGEHWQVESRQPANGAGKNPPSAVPTARSPLQVS